MYGVKEIGGCVLRGRKTDLFCVFYAGGRLDTVTCSFVRFEKFAVFPANDKKSSCLFPAQLI